MLPDSVSALVDSDDLRPSPCADPCCRLLLLVAFKGQEKGNVTPPNARLRPQILGIVRRSSYGTLRARIGSQPDARRYLVESRCRQTRRRLRAFAELSCSSTRVCLQPDSSATESSPRRACSESQPLAATRRRKPAREESGPRTRFLRLPRWGRRPALLRSPAR